MSLGEEGNEGDREDWNVYRLKGWEPLEEKRNIFWDNGNNVAGGADSWAEDRGHLRGGGKREYACRVICSRNGI